MWYQNISSVLLLRSGRAEEYCDHFACLCVCVIFYEIFVQIRCGRGSVLLRRRCDILCTSGFMDDVMLGPKGPNGDTWKAEPLTYYH